MKQRSAGKLQSVIRRLRQINVGAVLKNFTVFVAQQVVVGVVFYGINIAMSKLFKQMNEVQERCGTKTSED